MTAALALATIALGLASRVPPAGALLGKHPGDALYAVLVYWLSCAVRPSLQPLHAGGLAVLICFAVELLQLWQPPFLVSVRATTLGHLVLGSTFSVANLAAYVVGATAALGVDVLLAKAMPNPGVHRLAGSAPRPGPGAR